MEAAAAAAGLIGLAGQVMKTTIELRLLCKSYSAVKEDIDAASRSLQVLHDLMDGTRRLADSPAIIESTTVLTRTKMTNLLEDCEKDLRQWTYLIDTAIPKNVSKVKQRWKKLIVAADRPRLFDLTNKVMAYVNQLNGMLGVMRGDLGVATNATLVGMMWSHGIFEYNIKNQLDAINRGISSLQVSQEGFRRDNFDRLNDMGSTMSIIEVDVKELLYRSTPQAPIVDLEVAAFARLSVPYARNMNFVGRESILKQVESMLEMPKSNNRVALYGLGGVGKSQIALELAYRAHTAAPGLCCLWVSAVSRTTFAQSYREIASTLRIAGVNNPQADGLNLVKSWLQRETAVPWLMIVDNVDDLRTLKGETAHVDVDSFNLLKYLPQCNHGKLLFTSRSRTAALRITGGGMVIEIPLMDVSEAQQLLQVRLEKDNSQASQDCLELVKALEYLPLAISHAASYIREMSITPARYLRLFNDDKKMTRLLKHTYEDLARDGGQSNTVITTWRISFEQIQKDSPESAELLKIMGSLHWQSIPRYLLQQDKWEDDDDLNDAITPLLAFSLVQSSAELETFSMHRLIQIAIKSWTRTMEWERTAQRLLLQVFPRLEVHISISAEEDIVRCRQLLPHAQKVLEILGSPDMFSVPCVELKVRTAACLKILGQYQQARALYETLITPLVDFSEHHVSTEFSLANVEDEITRLYLLEGGNYNIAVQRAQLALKLRKEFLSESDPDIVSAKNLLALGLIELAQFKEAETQLQSAYTAAAETLGKTHIMTIAVLLSLTAVYRGQEQYQRAAETYQSVMDLLIPLHGENNDLIIECKAGMAEVQRCMLRTPEAGVLIRQALARSEETLGPDHPVTTSALTRLGCQRIDEGDKPGAYLAFERAWRNHRHMYGDESRLTLSCLGRMAVVHASLAEAEKLLKEAIERSKRVWGPLEKTTLGLEDDLFFVLFRRALGSSKQATEAYVRDMLEIRTKALGDEAKSTMRAAQNLVFVLLAQFKADEGQKLCLSTLNKQIKVLGSDSRDARVSSELLSSIYQVQRDFYASEVVLHQLISVLERIAGPDHSSTLNQKSRLGSIITMAYNHKKSGANKLRAMEGGTIMTEAYQDLLKAYGESDRTVIAAACRLAKYHGDMREFEESKILYQKAVNFYLKEFGEEGDLTMATQTQVAWTLVREGRYKDASVIYEKVYPLQLKKRSEDPFKPLITAMYWGSCMSEMDDSQVLRGLAMLKIAHQQSLTLFGDDSYLTLLLLDIVNGVRDEILNKKTAWELTAADRFTKFREFEVCFPFDTTDTTSPSLRRAKSWYLVTANTRLYQDPSAEDRDMDFRGLRGEIKLKSTPLLTCTRCQGNIPMRKSIYRCQDPSCTDNFAIVCQSCHVKGLSCGNFHHVPHLTKQTLICNNCSKPIEYRYAWKCSICADRACDICLPCQLTGISCPVDKEHKLIKETQPCFGDSEMTFHCDKCKNEIEETELRWSCDACWDYDICVVCWDKGERCADPENHVLVRRDIDSVDVDKVVAVVE